MVSNETDIYQIKRNKIVIAINLFIGIGLGYFFAHKLYTYWTTEPDYLWITIYAFLLTFVVRGFMTQLGSLIKNKPMLAISPLGIYSDIHGHLAKDDISAVKLSDLEAPKESLTVYLKNPTAYINSQKGIKKVLFNRIYEEKGTPIIIRLKGKYDRNELNSAIEQFL